VLVGFAGGVAQAGYVSRIRGLAPDRCLVVALDVGKRSAAAPVADHHGQVVGELFEFDLIANTHQAGRPVMASAKATNTT
jgi:hypothetical protein